MKDFVHLHLHTQYSLLDGAIKIKDLSKKATEYGYKAVAITDHGNLFGILDFYKEMKSVGIKPLIGMEAYFTTGSRFDRRGKASEDNITDRHNHHLILIAKNDQGLKNLMKLSTLSYKEGFYYKPRIDYELLSQYHKGLIAITACLKGVPTYYASLGEEQKAEEWVKKFLDLFGEDLYLELQSNSLPEQEVANKTLIKIAKRLGVKLVATNDSHYLMPEDRLAHQVLMAIQMKKTLMEIQQGGGLRCANEGLHFASPEEVWEKFKGKFEGWEEALKNTLEVAEKTVDNFELLEGNGYLMPHFPVEGSSLGEFLKDLSIKGLRQRIEQGLARDSKEYWDRLHYELDVVSRMGFEGYFLIVQDFINWAKSQGIPVDLPVKALGLDLVSNGENLENIRKYGFPEDKALIAGIINGRNVWRANLKEKLSLIEELSNLSKDLIISNSCPLFHLPVSVEPEDSLPEGLKERLSFAKEKLRELKTLKLAFEGEEGALKEVEESARLSKEGFGVREEVRRRIASLRSEDFQREVPYAERIKLQQEILNLPLLPTTTIGSFPQTEEVRKARTAYNSGKISEEEYKEFIRKQIEHVIRVQEEIGLDVLVHGEFERTDMVEFFAQRLEGIATTKHGWVLSYGSRVYRPPIIYGDVYRPRPMTVEEIGYAQSLTNKPVKGMLTGPVTILNWSYYREDIPKHEIAYQIALALLEEVKDLESAGIKVIQIDEPAFREGAPLKRRDWPSYFDWAVKAFRLCSKAKPQTQIHTHMCYSEFNEVIEYIYQMDFDVISIEASRSKGEIISAFESFKGWDRQIGIGVYDIHSPAVPTKAQIRAVLERAMKVLPVELLWVNPDCGLKTRRWEEVIPSLKNMVETAKELREELVKA